MFHLNFQTALLCLSLASASLGQNVQPSAADKAKYDAICARDAGPTYKAKFDVNGKPTGCVAEVKAFCFYGSYTDPKTGQPGCCGKGNGTFMTDSYKTTEGGCCIAPKKYSFDEVSGRGDCCDENLSFTVDPTTGKGSCCASNNVFTCDCACKPNPNPTCPKANGVTVTVGGKKYKLFCGLINHGSNDIAANEPAASWAACMERCSAISNCVRAIFDHNANLCYLRSFGNTDDPVETGVWDSAHLVEDPKPELLSESPKTCPEAEGKQVRLGGVDYQMFCTNGYSANLPMLAYPSATDVNDCLAQCSAEPQCQGANFWSDSNTCVMTSQHEFPPTGDTAPAVVSFVPLRAR